MLKHHIRILLSGLCPSSLTALLHVTVVLQNNGYHLEFCICSYMLLNVIWE